MKQAEKNRQKEIEGFIAFCLDDLEYHRGLSVKQVSKITGLCVSTIYRLRRFEFSTKTHFGTVQKLMRATGNVLKFKEN